MSNRTFTGLEIGLAQIAARSAGILAKATHPMWLSGRNAQAESRFAAWVLQLPLQLGYFSLTAMQRGTTNSARPGRLRRETQ
jgi:bacteriorhodopsin